MPQYESHPLYRALLYLYPKAHRQEYSEQMLQTFDDLLSEQRDVSGRLAIWVRVAIELPGNLTQEHIENIKGIHMRDSRLTSRQVAVIVGVAGLVAIAVISVAIRSNSQFQPTTLAKVARPANPPACSQRTNDPSVHIASVTRTNIENAATTSIIDIPAGTNVDVYIKSYSDDTASGTAIYSGKYGSYNLIAKKTASSLDHNYDGGWKITKFEACKQ